MKYDEADFVKTVEAKWQKDEWRGLFVPLQLLNKS